MSSNRDNAPNAVEAENIKILPQKSNDIENKEANKEEQQGQIQNTKSLPHQDTIEVLPQSNPKQSQEVIQEKIKHPKINVKPDIGFETRLIKAIELFGADRPTNRLEVDYEDITKEPSSTANANRTDANQPLRNTLTTSGLQNDNDQLSYNDAQGQLFYAKKAFIDQYYEIRDFFGLCPLYYRYHISLDFGISNKPPIHLFDVKDHSSPCGHDWCPNQARAINMDIIQFPLNKIRGPKERFAVIDKDYRCACSCLCACCNRPTMRIKIPSSDELIGKVVEMNTMCDPMIMVYDINDEIDYKIIGSCCQSGYCCRDLIMGKCSTCDFNIFKGNDSLKMAPCGKIRKRNIYGMKEKPDIDQLEVVFPEDATPKEKLALISAALMIVYLYFQNGSNSKKCHVKNN